MARILVSEAEPHLLRVICLWLERHGHRAIGARNGAEALGVMQQQEVDLLIVDVNMPVMDGVELTRKCEDQNLRPDAVIALTSRCDQREVRESIGKGAVLHPKPFSPSRLIEEVTRLLGGTNAPAEARRATEGHSVGLQDAGATQP